MARYNEILAARFNRALQKSLTMKGSVPAPQLSSEIMPVLPFKLGNEFRYLEAWNLFSLFMTSGPTAAATNAFQFRNPPTSTVIVVIQALDLTSVVVDTFLLSVIRSAQADLANVIASFGMDPRGIPSVGGGSTLIGSQNTGVASFATSVREWSVAANITFPTISTENQEWLLLPGDTFRVVNGTVNTTNRVNLLWRERSLEESERF